MGDSKSPHIFYRYFLLRTHTSPLSHLIFDVESTLPHHHHHHHGARLGLILKLGDILF